MRTLDAIIKAVESGEIPSVDELRYAVLVLRYLACFDHQAFQTLAAEGGSAAKEALESLARLAGAASMSPKEWVGWNSDPDNEEFQRKRHAALPTIH